MRSLFLKIFLWFWAAQILIGGALALFTAATQRTFDQQFQDAVSLSLEERARAAAITYEVGGLESLRQAWRFSPRPAAPPRNGGRGFGPPGNGPPGNGPPGNGPPGNGPPGNGPPGNGPPGNGPPGNGPPGNGPPGNGPPGNGPPGNGWPNDGPPNGSPDDDSPPNDGPVRPNGPFRGELAALYLLQPIKTARPLSKPQLLVGPPLPFVAASLLTGAATMQSATDAASVLRIGDATFLARGVQTPRGGRYLATTTLRFRGRRSSFFDGFLQFGPGPGGSLRWIIMALVMGLVCFALARYLTDPAIKLSRATRQFAAGDLGARVGPQLGRRRDELADLGHDFDRMAERIQTLLVSERRLLGDISHELRSPLTRLKLALDLAQPSADAQTRGYLERIETEAEELNALIGQLLTLTRLENAGSEPAASAQKYPLDVGEIVAHVAHNADFEAKSRGGRVEITRNRECELVGNGELLHSALENVVRNAILHSPQAPRVEVSLDVDEAAKQMLITVRDFGPGVPDEALPLLFRPFYRVAEARDRQSGGTGLGLSITQRAVEFHGGSVEAFNAVGGGLRVEIRLPV